MGSLFSQNFRIVLVSLQVDPCPSRGERRVGLDQNAGHRAGAEAGAKRQEPGARRSEVPAGGFQLG